MIYLITSFMFCKPKVVCTYIIWNKLQKHKVIKDGHLAPHLGQDAHGVGILPQWYIFHKML